MIKMINNPKYSAGLYPGWNKNGKHQLTCVIKTGFNFDVNGSLTAMSAPPTIEEVSKFSGEPNQSSLIAAYEIMPYKDRSEILIYGTAQFPKKMSAHINWNDKISWKKKGLLAKFGPISPYKNFKTKLIYNTAPSDQRFNRLFQGGEKICLKYILSNQEINLCLPNVALKIKLQLDQQTNLLKANCDTVVIDANKQTLHMICRIGIAWDINDQRTGILTIDDAYFNSKR